MPKKDLPKRRCECGCGRMYTPKRSDQHYATQTCKTRAYRARRRALEVEAAAVSADQIVVAWSTSDDRMRQRAYELVVEAKAKRGEGYALELAQTLIDVFGDNADWLSNLPSGNHRVDGVLVQPPAW